MAYRDLDDEDDDFDEIAPMPHSGLGIASFIVSLLAVFAVVGSIGAAVAMVASGRPMPGPESPEALMIGFVVLGGAFLGLVGLVLGIAALFQTDRKRLFAGLGIVFGAMTTLGITAMMIVGLTVAN